jgi:hypothetical protein
MRCYVSTIGNKTSYRSYLSNLLNITYVTSQRFEYSKHNIFNVAVNEKCVVVVVLVCVNEKWAWWWCVWVSKLRVKINVDCVYCECVWTDGGRKIIPIKRFKESLNKEDQSGLFMDLAWSERGIQLRNWLRNEKPKLQWQSDNLRMVQKSSRRFLYKFIIYFLFMNK